MALPLSICTRIRQCDQPERSHYSCYDMGPEYFAYRCSAMFTTMVAGCPGFSIAFER